MTSNISSNRLNQYRNWDSGSEGEDAYDYSDGFVVQDGEAVDDDNDYEVSRKRKRDSTTKDSLDALREKIMSKNKRRYEEAFGSESADSDEEFIPDSKRAKTSVTQKFTSVLATKETTHVVGREEEVNQILNMLAQPKGGQRPILIGPYGIGKKSIIRKLASKMVQGQCQASLNKRPLVLFDCLSFLAKYSSASSRDMICDELKDAIKGIYRKHAEPIIFFRDLDKLVLLSQMVEYLQTLFRSDSYFIASISGEDADEDISKAIRILTDYNFVLVPIKESPKEDVKEIVKNKLAKYPLPDSMQLDEGVIDTVVTLADKYIKDRRFPQKAINLLHESANFFWQNQKKEGGLLDSLCVARLMETKTGIPAEDMIASSWQKLAKLQAKLKEQVVGQDAAIATVCKRVNSHKMGLSDPSKPWAVLLFMGSTGVGKTELAKRLAVELYHDANKLIRIDLSEYVESHTVSRLIGAPPGYAGHESGGQLCNELKKSPHSVVLLDEIEKAHPDVLKVFLQVFDDGRLTDGKGETILCKDAIFIATTNIGASELMELSSKKKLDEKAVVEAIKPLLIKHLSPEFCNRFHSIVPFVGLQKNQYPEVVRVHLDRLSKRWGKEGTKLKWDAKVISALVKEDFDQKLGMRELCRHVEKTVTDLVTETAISQNCSLRGATVILKMHNQQLNVVIQCD